MKFRTKQLLDWSEQAGMMHWVQQMGRSGDQPIYILAYHRVDERDHQPSLDPTLLSSTPDLFRQEMELIAGRYHPVAAEQVLDALANNTLLPRDAVLVTVDDGYRDFKEVIFPITQMYGIRPVLFVPTAFVGQGRFWWDRVYHAVQFAQGPGVEIEGERMRAGTPEEKRATLDRVRAYLKRLPGDEMCQELERITTALAPTAPPVAPATLDWNELRALDRAGVTIAAHTHTHPILTRIPLSEARREICVSQEIIEREIGHSVPLFAFPDGKAYAYDDDLTRILREEGFRLAFTMVEGMARLRREDPLALPRLGMSARMNLAQFHLHLTPTYALRKQQQYGRPTSESRQHV